MEEAQPEIDIEATGGAGSHNGTPKSQSAIMASR